jgi:hypothetical protein
MSGREGCLVLTGRVVKAGRAQGQALVSPVPIGFLGGIDPETGIVIESGHPLHGEAVAGRILVFPTGKGSTVGSYTLYQMARNGMAPAGIINAEADPVVAVGAIISEIPMLDQVDLSHIATGDRIEMDEDTLRIVSTRPEGEGPEPASRKPEDGRSGQVR